MPFFRNDYGNGAHPVVLEALCRTNLELTPGYGADSYCRQAADTIRALCRCPDAAVHFLVGGTQVNKTAIGAFLRPYEAVAAAGTGHICVHESGAVEQDGHKVIHIPSPDGKLAPELLRAALSVPVNEHTTVPRLVYISNTTELGTVYSGAELRALRDTCGGLGLLLYCDGARLGSDLYSSSGVYPSLVFVFSKTSESLLLATTIFSAKTDIVIEVRNIQNSIFFFI